MTTNSSTKAIRLSGESAKTAGHCENSRSLRTRRPWFPDVSYLALGMLLTFLSGEDCHFPLQASKSTYLPFAYSGLSPLLHSFHPSKSEVDIPNWLLGNQ